VDEASTDDEQPTPGMWVLRPTFIVSAWRVALMTSGSTTASRFRSSMSRIRSMRRMSRMAASIGLSGVKPRRPTGMVPLRLDCEVVGRERWLARAE
jgi:hypothetical protein